MPFASKFRAMVDFPFAGEPLGSFTVESVGDKRYAVSVAGAAARVFLAYLHEEGHLATRPGGAVGQTLVEAYLERYRADIKRKVEHYASRLRSTKDT